MDFRTKSEIKRSRRPVTTASRTPVDHFKSDAEKRLREIEKSIAGLEQATQTNFDLYQTAHVDSQRTQQLVEAQSKSVTDEINQVYEMIEAGNESDMRLVNQMNENYERRLTAIMKMIEEI